LFRPVEAFFLAEDAAVSQALQQLAALLDVEFVAAELAQACFAAQLGFVGPVALDLGLPGVAMGRPGQRTGDAASVDEIREMRAATSLPLLVGSGVTPDNIATMLPLLDGVIVASTLKRDGVWWNEVEERRVAAFMERVETIRLELAA